ncbi:MAG: undecaprenyl-diphosphate phosphatase [Acidimicrobiales bacterium]
MDLLHALVLGAVQGLAEFLPISSSAHLELVGWALGWDDFGGDETLEQAFDVALHIGTLVGVVAYLWRDIVELVNEGLVQPVRGRGMSRTGKIAWLLVGTSIPAALVGAFFESRILQNAENITLIAIMLIVFGLILWWADRAPEDRSEDEFGLRDAVWLGAAQALALQPGVSRSGATMSVARKLRFVREDAARLVFLMSLPVIAGAGMFRAISVVADGGVPDELVAGFLVGTASAAVTGFIAVWGFLRIVRTWSFTPFVVYRVVLGVSLLVVIAMGFNP